MKKIISWVIPLIIVIATTIFFLTKDASVRDNSLASMQKTHQLLTKPASKVTAKNDKAQSPHPPSENSLETALPHIPLEEQEYDLKRIEAMESREWKQILKEVEEKLMSKANIRKLSPGQTHHVSPKLLESGRLLGLIRKITKAREEFVKEGEDFFFNCSQNQEAATPVRALCLTYYVQTKQDRGQKVDLEQFPKEVSRLAKEALSF